MGLPAITLDGFSAGLDVRSPRCIINPDMITRINEQAAAGTCNVDLVGNTPLLELPAISAETPGVRIFGKAEWYNPGGSVKDRPALWMIRGLRVHTLLRSRIAREVPGPDDGAA